MAEPVTEKVLDRAQFVFSLKWTRTYRGAEAGPVRLTVQVDSGDKTAEMTFTEPGDLETSEVLREIARLMRVVWSARSEKLAEAAKEEALLYIGILLSRLV
jgi:hypothetical protein